MRGSTANETHADLVEKETGKTRGDDGVTDQEVPASPLPLNPAERCKVGASVELLCGVLVEDGGGRRSRVKGHDREGKGEGRGFGNDSPSCTPTTPSKNRTTLFFPRLLRSPIYLVNIRKK